jgi:thiol-disulfide isomerase/thioredoxin
MSRRVLCGVAGVALAFLVTACGSTSGPGAKPGQPQPAPEFALKDLSGKTVRLSDSAGRVRLIDFWATWCPPCREAIPHLNELHADYEKDGLSIIGISMDDDADELVPPFVEKYRIHYTMLVGNEAVAEAFGGVFGLPTTILVDRSGNVAETWVGGIPKKVIEERVRTLLGLPAA